MRKISRRPNIFINAHITPRTRRESFIHQRHTIKYALLLSSVAVIFNIRDDNRRLMK